MNTISVLVKKLNKNATIPSYGTEFSAGADLYSCIDDDIIINPGSAEMISTGISVELPEGTVGLIYARSGMAVKRGLAPSNKVGVIDSDYRGEIKVSLYNQGNEIQIIKNGERIAQMIVTPYYFAEYCESSELTDTVRGSGGFGSTGIK